MDVLSGFDVKLVVFGNYFEVYKYTKPIRKNYKKPKKIKKMETQKQKGEGKRFNFSINRTRNTVRRLVSANFTKESSFVTLTFASGGVHDARVSNVCFKQFIRYIRHYINSQGDYPVENFKYLAVIEFQKDVNFYGKVKPLGGSIHYHIIMECPFIPQEILKIAWPYGFFKINRTEHVENIGAYVSKYLYKDVADPRLRGIKAYQTSRNLIRPIEVTDKQDIRNFLNFTPKTLVKKNTFDNDFTGRVYCRRYKRTLRNG
jgi:hypothetical protein